MHRCVPPPPNRLWHFIGGVREVEEVRSRPPLELEPYPDSILRTPLPCADCLCACARSKVATDCGAQARAPLMAPAGAASGAKLPCRLALVPLAVVPRIFGAWPAGVGVMDVCVAPAGRRPLARSAGVGAAAGCDAVGGRAVHRLLVSLVA